MVLTNMDGDVDEDLYAALSAHFSDAEVLELGTVMAIIAGMAKLSFILHLVEREEYCPFASAAAKQKKAGIAGLFLALKRLPWRTGNILPVRPGAG